METVVVKLTGRMTLGMRLCEIESKVTRDVDEGTHKLVLDLSGVDYADSSGLGFLMLLHGRVKTKGGQLRLAGPNKSCLPIGIEQKRTVLDSYCSPSRSRYVSSPAVRCRRFSSGGLGPRRAAVPTGM
jgi:anti-anti-sigma factor